MEQNQNGWLGSCSESYSAVQRLACPEESKGTVAHTYAEASADKCESRSSSANAGGPSTRLASVLCAPFLKGPVEKLPSPCTVSINIDLKLCAIPSIDL
jgi:hypothetical protein